VDQEQFRTVTQEAHNEFFKGNFQSQLFISYQKSELIRQWMLTLISDITGIQVEKTIASRTAGPKKVNQKPQLHLATEMKAFKNSNQQESNCAVQ
jgi:hypothetical protein